MMSPDPRPFMILKMGSTLPSLRARRGDFEDWVARGAGLAAAEVRVIDVPSADELPQVNGTAGVMVTGSHTMVTERQPWSERAAEWLRVAMEHRVPVLGICYGHQLLAHALGGRVGRNPRGREIGTVRLRLAPEARRDALLGDLPEATHAHTTHVESVLELPPGGTRLAESDADPNQAFAAGPRAWGVQFHPEFDADVMRGYLESRRDLLRDEGLDADRLLALVRETPEAGSLLRRFAALCGA